MTGRCLRAAAAAAVLAAGLPAALATPAPAAAAPLRFPTLIASTQPVFVVPESNARWDASAEFFIDAHSIARLAPGVALPMHTLGLDEGTHQFRFSITLRPLASAAAADPGGAAEIEEDCVGQFEVRGTGVLQPHVEIHAWRPAPGKAGDTVTCGVSGP